MFDCTYKCKSRQHGQQAATLLTVSKDHEKELIGALSRLCTNVGKVRDNLGQTALHIAASTGKLEVVEWLLKVKDAAITATDSESGYTPLHRSLFYGQLHIARALLRLGASLTQVDYEHLSPIDHVMKDRLPGALPSIYQPSEVYVWGSNTNHTLGQGSSQNRLVPELLETFRKENVSIKQVCMEKFHTVFVSQSGQVYSCGHGHGGRLGQDVELTSIYPQPLKSLQGQVCIQAAVGMDHTVLLMESGTVWTCGSNTYHQLGHNPPPPVLLSPKPLPPINCVGKGSKGKVVEYAGICASRFHTVLWNEESIYTCGLNAGHLGHLKGEKTIISPKQVTAFSLKDTVITHVVASEGATLIATKKGDIYLLHEYQCRKIASKQLEIEKIVMVGGNLDPKLDPKHLLTDKGGVELQVMVLTKSGKLLLWTEHYPVLSRCLHNAGRQLIIGDVALSKICIVVVSHEGESFQGFIMPKKEKKQASNTKESPEKRELTASLLEFIDRDTCYQIKMKRLPHVFRAVAAACDLKGRNFAVLQNHPAANLTEIPQLEKSDLAKHLQALLDEADVMDSIHDVVFQVGVREFAAHRFIIASRCEALHKLVMDVGSQDEKVITVTLTDINPAAFQLVLNYIYTGTCVLLEFGKCSFSLSSKKVVETPKEPIHEIPDYTNGYRSAYEVYGHNNRQKNAKKKKKTKKESQDEEEVIDLETVATVQETAKKLGVYSLVKALEQVRLKNGYIVRKNDSTRPFPPPHLQFQRWKKAELCDAVIVSQEGKEIGAHRCLLAARLEYFRSMFGCGWIETASSAVLTMPIPHNILEVVLDFLYEDEAPKVSQSDDLEFIGNILVVSDQLLVHRLASICENTLVGLLTLKNAPELLQFSITYNAKQLKAACLQYLCLNLPSVIELRLWDILDEETMEELTRYYRDFNPIMSYRRITPHSGVDVSLLSAVDEDEGMDDISTMEERKSKSKRRTRYKSESGKTDSARVRTLSTSSTTSQDLEESMHNLSFDQEEPVKASSPRKHSEWTKVKSKDKPKKSAELTPQSPAKTVNRTLIPGLVLPSNSPANTNQQASPIVTPAQVQKPVVPVPLPQVKASSPPLSHNESIWGPPLPTPAKAPSGWAQVVQKQNSPSFPSLTQGAVASPKKGNEISLLDLNVEVQRGGKLSQKQKKKMAKEEQNLKMTQAEPVIAKAAAWAPVTPDCSKMLSEVMKIEEKEVENKWIRERNDSVTESVTSNNKVWGSEASVRPRERKTTETRVSVSDTSFDVSFEKILADEMQMKANLAKAKSKPLRLTQIEDQAIEELKLFYSVDNVFEEHVYVVRVTEGALATPTWCNASSHR